MIKISLCYSKKRNQRKKDVAECLFIRSILPVVGILKGLQKKHALNLESRRLIKHAKMGVMMVKNNEVIQTHPLVGWDISTVDSYDALMLRLHYQTPNRATQEETEVGQTLWLTTDVARQFISILEAGIAKIESGDYQEDEYRRH